MDVDHREFGLFDQGLFGDQLTDRLPVLQLEIPRLRLQAGADGGQAQESEKHPLVHLVLPSAFCYPGDPGMQFARDSGLSPLPGQPVTV